MALVDDMRNLGSVPAFADLEPEALRLIAFSADTRILRAGAVLFRRGEPSDGGFVVLSGTIALEMDPQVTLVRAPALIGETALVAETVRPATATAREPSSVLRITRALFRRVLSEFPDSAVRVRVSAAQRLLSLQAELAALEGHRLR